MKMRPDFGLGRGTGPPFRNGLLLLLLIFASPPAFSSGARALSVVEKLEFEGALIAMSQYALAIEVLHDNENEILEAIKADETTEASYEFRERLEIAARFCHRFDPESPDEPVFYPELSRNLGEHLCKSVWQFLRYEAGFLSTEANYTTAIYHGAQWNEWYQERHTIFTFYLVRRGLQHEAERVIDHAESAFQEDFEMWKHFNEALNAP